MVNAEKLYEQTVDILKQSGIESFEFEAKLLLAHFTGIERTDIDFLNKIVDQENAIQLIKAVGKRATRYPLQYLLGVWEFMSLPFFVKEHVLIPRADTEIITEHVISLIGEQKQSVLDLCTGSGCIAVSIAHYCKNAQCIGVDISEDAVMLARKNALRNAVQSRVKIVHNDIFSYIPEISFDIIISNPPYLTTEETKQLADEMCFEPKLALDGGEDGLSFYHKIAKKYMPHLKNNGHLLFECAPWQAEQIGQMLTGQGLCEIAILKDYAGQNRVVSAMKRAK